LDIPVRPALSGVLPAQSRRCQVLIAQRLVAQVVIALLKMDLDYFGRANQPRIRSADKNVVKAANVAEHSAELIALFHK